MRRATLTIAVATTAGLLATASVAAPHAAGARSAEARKPLARNLIVLIDDGAGYNHHEAGSLFDTGLRHGETYDDFPFRFAMSTYSYGDVEVGQCPEQPVGYDPRQAWSDFTYVEHDPTDSAAAATAMATGVKTYDSAIGVDCQGTRQQNVSEVAEELGKATGVVTSVPFSHATPAGFVVHDTARDDFAGIGHQMVQEAATDVVMGAGHPLYTRKGAPAQNRGYEFIAQPDWEALVAGTAGGDADGDQVPDPWTLVQTPAEFRALTTGETPTRVFGMAQVRRSLQVDRGGDLQADPYVVPALDMVPTLPEMATGALNVLDEDPDGFFVMIEGGATDLASHNNLKGRMIEEEISFDRTVDAALAWVDQHSNWGETAVVVASDHETGYLTGPGSGPTPEGPVWTPLVDNGAGAVPGMQFNLVAHTNSLVPVFAKGDAARLLRGYADQQDPVRGRYLDNTELHQVLVDAITP
ncbi:alkaline phosphatase [Nocardioides sp. MAHUQ-72]|uniref:alkaline phosphatase n=1 Tax=unclassified Nocardioides TaxID=2615069 RepID=UPI0036161389